MANVILIMGKSGSGKSTSIKTLDPKTTVIFNVLKKKLPFKGSSKLYNTENNNLFMMDNFNDIISYMQAISEKATDIRNIVIDDATYIMRKEYFKTAKQTGFNKFIDMASHFQSIISTAENMRDNMNVFLIMHSEDVVSDNVIVGYKPSTVGKLIDNSYNPIEVVPMLLYSAVKYDENKQPIYGFYTHRYLDGNIEIPAKSPAEMFKDDFIPNDLCLVVKSMDEYYNG